jgi:arylsulfatase A-like enzyme
VRPIGPVVLAALALLVAAVGSAAAQAPAADPPNVVIVLTDDQRTGTLGPERTPAIWNLIRRRGVSYPQAFIPTSVCCPSRASILTGLFAHSTGVYSNTTADGGGWPAFYANCMEDRTLAVALHDAGYRTGLVGKYLNGGPPFPGHVPPGWDVFAEVPGGYYDYTFAGQAYGSAPEDYSTDVLRGAAIGFIGDTPPGQPLFLYFAPYAPHAASIPAPRHEDAWKGRVNVSRLPPSFRENLRDKPPWIRRLRKVTGRHRYVDVLERRQEAMMAVDEAVAALVGELRTTGRLRNTLIVFLSDNGVLLGEHRLYGFKNFPYRMAIQVPMLARWDGHIEPGSTYRAPALNVDLAPTIAHAAGVAMTTEGIDLVGPKRRKGFPLEGKDWQHTPRLVVPAFCGYRTSRFVYARYATGDEELYDYQRDPYELENAARRLPRIRAYLEGRARATCSPVPPGFTWDGTARLRPADAPPPESAFE